MAAAEHPAPPLSLDEQELDQVEAIFLRHIDEDDAMSILQDLVGDGFLIANERLLADVVRAGFQRLLDMSVEQRMKAMGMRPTLDHSFDRTAWVEAT